MSLHDAVAGYIEAVTSGSFDMPRRRVADDLRALLAAYPETAHAADVPPAPAVPDGAGAEYAILSYRDGLEPVDSLEEAVERMSVFWRKPGRARIVHRTAWATDWVPLDPAAAGPVLEAA